MCRRSDTLRENRRCEPIFDEKGFPREKTQNETGEAVEVSVFVPWGALSTLSTCSKLRISGALVKSYHFNWKMLRLFLQPLRLSLLS